MKWLNFQHLIYFREIARTGSIANASRKLLVSPPALSSQLKVLEEQIGRELFDRKGKKLIINSYGENVLKYADQIHFTGEELLYEINNLESTDRSRLNIAYSTELPKVLPLNVVEVLNSKFNIETSLLEGTQEDLARRMNNFELDIIFTNKPIQNLGSQLVCRCFKSEQIALYGSAKFKSLKKNFPKSIKDQDFVLPTIHSDIRQSLDRWFYENDMTYNLKAQVQDSSMKKELATNSMGIIPLSTLAAKKHVESKLLYHIGDLDNLSENYFYTVNTKKVKENEILSYLTQYLQNL